MQNTSCTFSRMGMSLTVTFSDWLLGSAYEIPSVLSKQRGMAICCWPRLEEGLNVRNGAKGGVSCTNWPMDRQSAMQNCTIENSRCYNRASKEKELMFRRRRMQPLVSYIVCIRLSCLSNSKPSFTEAKMNTVRNLLIFLQ